MYQNPTENSLQTLRRTQKLVLNVIVTHSNTNTIKCRYTPSLAAGIRRYKQGCVHPHSGARDVSLAYRRAARYRGARYVHQLQRSGYVAYRGSCSVPLVPSAVAVGRLSRAGTSRRPSYRPLHARRGAARDARIASVRTLPSVYVIWLNKF